MIDAKEYGRAIFELAEEAKSTEKILNELKLVEALFERNIGYQNLLDTPAISKNEKISLIDAAFKDFDDYVVNLLKVLCERHSVYMLKKTAQAFSDLYDEANGIERVDAITAVSMTSQQLAAMQKKLEAITEKKIIVNNIVDKSILGGVVLRYSGVQLDGSIKTRLDDFRKSLSNIVM